MPRVARIAPAGTIFHVLNRDVGRRTIFARDGDYAAFERCLAHALATVPAVDLLAYCLMPNHWHLLVRPTADDALGRYMHRLTMTHTRRWQEHRGAVGEGHLYQGRFKSFPVQGDGHLLTVARYVERNPRRAGLAEAASQWPWSSLNRRCAGVVDRCPLPLAAWPVDYRGDDWATFVDAPRADAEVAAVRASLAKGRPFGDDRWQRGTIDRLGLESTARPAGRPRKAATT